MSHTPSLEAAARMTTVLLWLPVALGLAGCSGLEPVATHEAVTDPTQLYTTLTLEHRAVNLATAAPYHTIQLVATPRDGRGEVMAGLPAPSFRLAESGDTALLSVTPDGMVTARAAASRIAVIAELTAPGPIRHADTVLISVTTDVPPVVDSFSIHPLAPDSTIRAAGVYDQSDDILSGAGLTVPAPENLAYRAADPSGSPISDLVVEYQSLDPGIATIERWTGARRYGRPGSVRFVARTMAYGTLKVDTVTFTITWPLSATLYAKPGATGELVFEPFEVRVAPYAIVFFAVQRGDFVEPIPESDSVDVVFDDPSAVVAPPAAVCDFIDFVAAFIGIFGPGSGCGTGNVLMPGLPPDPDGDFLPAGIIVARQFLEPGVYRFHSIRAGTIGRIIVTPGADGSTP